MKTFLSTWTIKWLNASFRIAHHLTIQIKEVLPNTNAFYQLDGQILPGLARDSRQEEHLRRPSHLRCRAWGHVELRKSLSWSDGCLYFVLIEHFLKVKDRRISSREKIKRKEGGNGASYSWLFRHQPCVHFLIPIWMNSSTYCRF